MPSAHRSSTLYLKLSLIQQQVSSLELHYYGILGFQDTFSLYTSNLPELEIVPV